MNLTEMKAAILSQAEQIKAITARLDASDAALLKALSSATPENIRALGQGLKAQIRSEAESLGARLAVNLAAQAGVPSIEDHGSGESEGSSTDEAHAAHMKRLNRFHGDR